jgi:beta-lactam-binding protein with PASTA domain
MKKMIAATLIGGTALLGLSACSSAPTEPKAATTFTQTVSAPAAPAPVAVTNVTIPDVAGQNAEIVRQNLADLGLTNVVMASANPKYSMVLLAANWTVVSIEPGPGTTVRSDDPVVIKATKP